MRKTFLGYYRPTENEFKELWDECLFVLDTNVLIDLYRVSPDVRRTIFKILNGISARLWVPYQVALEYHENRLDVIKEQREAYKNIKVKLTEFQDKVESELNSFKKHPLIKSDPWINKIETSINEINADLDLLEQKHPDWDSTDEILDEITVLLDGKVGPKYSDVKLDEIYKDGKQRYENKVPPGFRDIKKDGNGKYGDLIIWLQTIDKANETKKPIIFVTDDRKEDWWRKFDGKTVGPHPKLVHEMLDKAKVSCYVYQTEQFIKYAQQYLKTSDVDVTKVTEELRNANKFRSDSENKEVTSSTFSWILNDYIKSNITFEIQFLISTRYLMERELRRISQKYPSFADKHLVNPRRVLMNLAELGLLDKALLDDALNVWDICTRAVHSRPVESEDVDFVKNALPLIIENLAAI